MSNARPMPDPAPRYQAFPPSQVRLAAGDYQQRRDLNRVYLRSLTDENLLQN
ncbi:MAG: hypothetical protein HOV67_26635, partial [Kribbellaceae bacterium]|nr:hypothetical protein [Kribbellaceae bacterium]